MKIKRSLLSMFVFVFVFILSIFLTPSSKTEDVELEEITNVETKETQSRIAAADDLAIHSLSSEFREIPLNNGYAMIQQDKSEEADAKTIINSSVNSDETKDINSNKDETISQKSITKDKSKNTEHSKDNNNIEDTESTTKKEVTPEIKEKYSNIGISHAKSYVNVRTEASTDASVVGKLYRNSAATILEKIGDWYYIESGSVKGYVSAEFIKTGLSDAKLIKNYGKNYVRVNVDGLNVRKEPDSESKKVTTIYQNELYPVLLIQKEWIEIDVTDENSTGFVRRDLIDLQVTFTKAVSKEEEQELERLKKEAALKKATEIKYGNGVSYTNEDVKLLAALIHAEAGSQTYEGKLAVANIVLNRMKSNKYPNSMKSVIYQPGQFTVASSGSLSKQLNNYANYYSNSQKLSTKAAQSALEGANNVGNRLYFHSYKAAVKKGYENKANAVKIDDQLFW